MYLTRSFFLLLFSFYLSINASQEPLKKSEIIPVPKKTLVLESEGTSIESSSSIISTVLNSAETSPKSGSPSRRDSHEGVPEIHAALKKTSQEILSAHLQKSNLPPSSTGFNSTLNAKLMEVASMLQQIAEDAVIKDFSKRYFENVIRNQADINRIMATSIEYDYPGSVRYCFIHAPKPVPQDDHYSRCP